MRIATVLLLLFFSSYPAVLRAQSTYGSTAGPVTDPTKAVIVDAKVASINVGTNARYEQSVEVDDRVEPLECGQAAQDRIGTLSGTVSDFSGAVISGALITATCGSFRQEVTTDSTGAYSLQLSTGRYLVRVTANNFTPTEREVVLYATGPVVEWKVILTLTTVQTRVSVTSAGYSVTNTTAGSKMDASLLDVPQSITVVASEASMRRSIPTSMGCAAAMAWATEYTLPV
jgi:hypothetical protein